MASSILRCSGSAAQLDHYLSGTSPRADLLATPRRRAVSAIAALALGWTAYATLGVIDGGRIERDAAAHVQAKDAEVAALRRQVAGMRRDVGALESAVAATAARIEARQGVLAALVDGKSDVLLAAAAPAPAVAPQYAALLAPLAALEGRQLALIGQASSAADARYQGATALIRGLGLSPSRFLRVTSIAMGGPLEPVAGTDPGAPKLRDLYQAWNRLAQLGQAAAAIPGRAPAANFSYTSGFGVRYDPFNGASAMHAGVDMAGPVGEPIAAAAEGVVTRAGWMGGYGNLIEIDHGRGMSTRYGHLSRIQVRVGDRVVIGDQIGKMGSTGRSTGSHLHFEVRVDGRAVDPMPYLRAAPAIAAMQASGTALGGPVVAPPR